MKNICDCSWDASTCQKMWPALCDPNWSIKLPAFFGGDSDDHQTSFLAKLTVWCFAAKQAFITSSNVCSCIIMKKSLSTCEGLMKHCWWFRNPKQPPFGCIPKTLQITGFQLPVPQLLVAINSIKVMTLDFRPHLCWSSFSPPKPHQDSVSRLRLNIKGIYIYIYWW